MQYRHIRHLFAVLAVVSIAAFATPSHAENDGDEAKQPAAGSSAPDADESGGVTPLAPPAYSHVNPRGQAAPAPEPAGMPTTSKSGDDLVVHTSGGDTTYPGYLKGLSPGQGVSVSVVVPGHGGCVLQVDGNGSLMSSKCDQ